MYFSNCPLVLLIFILPVKNSFEADVPIIMAFSSRPYFFVNRNISLKAYSSNPGILRSIMIAILSSQVVSISSN